LLKKGEKRHNWKTRWFKANAANATLQYFDSPELFSNNQKGVAIPLLGALVDYAANSKHAHHFTVTEKGGARTYQLRAGSAAELDDWVRGLGAICRGEKHVARQVKAVDMEEMVLALHAGLAGTLKTAKGGGLSGGAFVDWLVDNDYAATRMGAVGMGKQMNTYLKHVSGDVTQSFEDSSNKLYRFDEATVGDMREQAASAALRGLLGASTAAIARPSGGRKLSFHPQTGQPMYEDEGEDAFASGGAASGGGGRQALGVPPKPGAPRVSVVGSVGGVVPPKPGAPRMSVVGAIAPRPGAPR
jgi:hypothetical protein